MYVNPKIIYKPYHMTQEKKQQAITLLKQGLETVLEREYREIAEIPTDDENIIQVKYSFVYDGVEGIFTVIGQPQDEVGDSQVKLSLLSQFDEDSTHHESLTAKDQVDNDLINVEEYLNLHINQG